MARHEFAGPEINSHSALCWRRDPCRSPLWSQGRRLAGRASPDIWSRCLLSRAGARHGLCCSRCPGHLTRPDILCRILPDLQVALAALWLARLLACELERILHYDVRLAAGVASLAPGIHQRSGRAAAYPLAPAGLPRSNRQDCPPCLGPSRAHTGSNCLRTAPERSSRRLAGAAWSGRRLVLLCPLLSTHRHTDRITGHPRRFRLRHRWRPARTELHTLAHAQAIPAFLMKGVLSIQACIAQLLQPVRHHSFETSRIRYSVRPRQGRSQFLVEVDEDESSLEYCAVLHGTKCHL